MAYTLDNPVAAKLVDAVDEWPGLNLLGWLLEHERKRDGRGAAPSGLTQVIHCAFDHRPRNQMKSRRPYVFGNQKGCAETFAMMSRIHTKYRARPDRFLGGDRSVEFPAGTYLLPIIIAA